MCIGKPVNHLIDFVEHCFQVAPLWLSIMGSWEWYIILGFIFIILFVLFGGYSMHHFHTIKYPPYLRLGWLTGDINKPSKPAEWQSDYRFWVFMVLVIGWLGFIGLNWFFLTGFLTFVGVDQVWELSPTGISLLNQYARIICVSSGLWVFVTLLGLGIIWVDPYNLEFRLTLGTVLNGQGNIEFANSDGASPYHGGKWKPDQLKIFKQRAIYINPNATILSLKDIWTQRIKLEFNEIDKTLSGLGEKITVNDQEMVRFLPYSGNKVSVDDGGKFVIMDDKDHPTRFTFSC